MSNTLDLNSLFDIRDNHDAKRFEFTSKTHYFTSYTVAYHEADNLDDAKIAVYKAVKIELDRQSSVGIERLQKILRSKTKSKP